MNILLHKEYINIIRSERNELLKKTDIYMINDYKINSNLKLELIKYRQNLRDVINNINNIINDSNIINEVNILNYSNITNDSNIINEINIMKIQISNEIGSNIVKVIDNMFVNNDINEIYNEIYNKNNVFLSSNNMFKQLMIVNKLHRI